MVDATALIEVDHVFKTYPVADRGERLVLDDLNFRLIPGEIVAVLASLGPASLHSCGWSPACQTQARGKYAIAATG